MIVIADSSPLRYLIVMGKQDLLPRLFGETWVPAVVVDELSYPASPVLDDAAGRREAALLQLRGRSAS